MAQKAFARVLYWYGMPSCTMIYSCLTKINTFISLLFWHHQYVCTCFIVNGNDQSVKIMLLWVHCSWFSFLTHLPRSCKLGVKATAQLCRVVTPHWTSCVLGPLFSFCSFRSRLSKSKCSSKLPNSESNSSKSWSLWGKQSPFSL